MDSLKLFLPLDLNKHQFSICFLKVFDVIRIACKVKSEKKLVKQPELNVQVSIVEQRLRDMLQ